MKSRLSRLAAGAATSFAFARSVVDRHYGQRGHIVMETADGRVGFALFGGFRARHRFGALYLPDAEPVRTRFFVHRPVTADDSRQLARRFGLVVFCGDSAPPELTPDLLTIPLNVDMEMPLPAVLQGQGAPWGRSAKANIAKVRKGRFEVDVARADEWIGEFYRRMLRPSMRGRHGATTLLDSHRVLARAAQSPGSELLRVIQDGKWVGGILNHSSAEGYRFVKLGWLHGDPDLFRNGIVSALYWFSMQRAAILGHRRILLGSVDPSLENGVLIYKGHWGGRLSHVSRRFGKFRLLLEPSHPACLRFLQKHSLITTGIDERSIVFSAHGPDADHVSPGVRDSVARWYQWRDCALDRPEVTSEDVPRRLRPWVTCCEHPR